MAYLTLSLFEKVDKYLTNQYNSKGATVTSTPFESASATESLLEKSAEVLCGYDYEKAIDVSNLINKISIKKKGSIDDVKSKRIENKCLKCLKTFTDAFQLERHKKRKNHKRFSCEVCPKNYATRFCLNRHARTAHFSQ